jgi:uncharacterized membrane protein YsdA (DUF1294 family)
VIYILFYLFFINLIAFITMYNDKQKAKRNEWRVPERALWILSFVGGSLGILFGMRTFRHKTKHSSFKFGVPLTILIQLAIFIVALQKLS